MPFRTAKSSVWQYDIVVGGHRLRGSTGTKDFEEAKQVEARIRSEGKRQTGGRFTVSEALGTYFRDVAMHQPSAATTSSQSKAIIKALGGSTRLDAITDARMMKAVATWRSTLTNATSNRRVELWGRVLKHMVKYKAELPDLDLAGLRVKEPKERVRELSMEEQTELFKHLPEDVIAPVKFCLMTGCRISTMCDLRWTDVRDREREMIFRLKGGDVMTFPLSREISALLSSLPRSNVVNDARYVFTRINKQTAERCRIVPVGGVFNQQFRAARDAAGIEDFRFHDLRHTFATRMLRATGNLKLVSRLLGHRSLETTMRYAHVLNDDLRNALEGNSMLSGGDPQTLTQTRRLSH